MNRAIIAMLLLLAASAHSQSGIILGYVTGNEYMKLRDDERTLWLIGVMDGMMAEDLVANKRQDGPWLGHCIRSLPKIQIKAMLDQELQSRPDTWHAPAALAFRDRMGKFCKERS